MPSRTTLALTPSLQRSSTPPSFRRHETRAHAAAAIAAGLAAGVLGCTAARAQPSPQTGAENDGRVVVTAARHAQLAVDAPASLTVVTREEIEDRGADNLLDAVRGSAGISLQGRAIGGRQVLSLRGLDSRHTLFLVDGRRVAASDGVIGHSDFQYDWIAVEDIARIEVVRGPLSVLYGAEAMGGVINVITRQPTAEWRLGASAEASQADGGRGGDGLRANLRVDGPLANGLALRAGAHRTRRAAQASATDARIDELEGREKTDGWAALTWRATPGQRLEGEYRVTQEDRWAGARERSGARRYHQSKNLIDRSFTSLAWDADWGDVGAATTVSTQLRAYRADLTVDNLRTNGVTVNPSQSIDDRVLEGQARAGIAAHDLMAGFESRNDGFSDPGLPGGRSVAQLRSLFVQDELAVARALRLTLGVRHDRHNLFGSQTSPRAYVVWRDDAWTIKGGYSHGFMAPNLKQIVPGARAEGPNTFLGNPQLRPETSVSTELGVGWQQAAREWQLTAFDQRVSDLIGVKLLTAGPVPGTGTYTYENVSKAHLSGAEASVAQPIATGVSLALSYTYLDATGDDGQRLVQRPRHVAAMRLDWQQGRWRGGLRVEHSGDQLLAATTVGASPMPAPDVTLVGAHLTCALPEGLELTIGVNNLTEVSLAAKSPLFTAVEPLRTWRLALRGRW